MTADMRETSLGHEPGDARPDTPLRIALFSNQELIRAGLASLLAQSSERVEVFDPASTADAHDVVVFDLVSASGEARGPALRHLGRLVEAKHVVVAVTREENDELATRARALGCADVVPLSVTAEELLEILEGAVGEPGEAQEAPPRVLTRRETEIVELIARGLSNTEIASTLFLSVNSVKTYIRTAYRKMGVTTRSQAVLWAVSAGLGAETSHESRS